ncbi:ATP-binding protein [Roseibium sp.]|uniref:ATP-binding protein n=1 Tax=Roseibium sp. TaxID=1936156 RepID=UPI003D11E18B
MSVTCPSATIEQDDLDDQTSRIRFPDPEGIREYIAQSSSSFGCLLQGAFQFTTHEEAERLSALLALNTPDPERAAMGIWELLSNAIEHGNLEIDMELKADLLMQDAFQDEIRRRHTQSPYRDRFAIAEFSRGPDRVTLKVTDQGKGFDFETYLSADFPVDGPNGRGIKIAQQFCFDTLRYEEPGNVVEGTILVPKAGESRTS